MTLQAKHMIGTRNSRSARVGALIAGLLCAGASGAATEGGSNNYFGTDAGGPGGTSNSFFGAYAGDSNTGDDNTATGASALYSNTVGIDNTASGAYALFSNTTGSYNTASGTGALYSNVLGSGNTASGALTLHASTSSSDNTASGYSALYRTTTGSYNTAVGSEALSFNTTGTSNSAEGYAALYSNTTGKNNAASGARALYQNSAGKDNTASGFAALQSSKGSENTANGYAALENLKSGDGNIALGGGAGSMLTSGSNDIYIGAPGTVDTESGVTRIGSVQTKVYVAGISGVPLSGASVVVTSGGQLGVVASSQRYKQQIADLPDESAKLAQLRPVSYQYRTEPDRTHYGLIAEEVQKVMPEIVVLNQQRQPESVQYLELIPLLLQQQRAQQVVIAQLKAALSAQSDEIVHQRDQIAALRDTLDERLAQLDAEARDSRQMANR